MLKRLRTAHPILYCILSEVLFLGSMVVFSLLATIVLAAAGADFDTMDGYLFGSVQEAVGLAVALLLLARTGRLDLLRRRGCGFLNGLLVGMYPLFFIGYTAFGTLAFGRPDTPLLPLPRILTFLLNMIFVGVAEELVFRGIIAQTLLERYGTARAGVWKACLVSGVLFGAAHLSNLLGSAPFGVLMQCVFAASLGVMLAAIYFRTGNLWVTVFLHSAMDIAAMLIGGLYGTTSVAESVSGFAAAVGGGVPDPHPVSAAQKEAAGGAAVLGRHCKKLRLADKNLLAICCAIWYTVSVTVARGWEYARFWENRFPPLCHRQINYLKEVLYYE